MADPIATGSTGSGHGRGMSQWGSQYWAKGIQGLQVTYPREWRCIIDHYYNDNGNTTGAGAGLRTTFINGPGGDGPVAYTVYGTNSDIYSMNIDGSAVTRLTNDRAPNGEPSWSPSGSNVAFRSIRNNVAGVWTMKFDGSGETLIKAATGGTDILDPTWSPLNDQIAFAYSYPGCVYYCLSMVSPDGTGELDLNLPLWAPNSTELAWSPDGSKIAYISPLDQGLHVVNADGSGDTLIYNDPTKCQANGYAPCNYDPSWSPDGRRIAFAMLTIPSVSANGIYLVNSDGTNLFRLTAPADGFHTCELHPSWSADGRTIVFMSNRSNPVTCNSNIQIFSVDVNTYNVTLINGSPQQYDPYPDCRRCGRFDRL
jgi:Tol biopolymer transport system component